MKEEVELVCGTCGLPVAGQKARTDVTRYLSDLSRCQCRGTESSSAGAASTDSAAGEPGDGALAAQSFGALAASAAKSGVNDSVSLERAAEILGERFEVLSFLGQGGMGSVFKVREKQLDKTFAVKILDPRMVKDAHSVKRFEQEAKAAIQLTHPHLAAVYEYGIGDQGTPYIVMDYLEGRTLAEILEQETYLDHGRALDLFIQLCEGVNYAHMKGVIHRDIKPNNIMISKSESGVEYAKLFDFGIAKVMPERAIDFTHEVTQTGELFGSPAYMSPEQLKGLSVDERTDIHALGSTLYKCLTGILPFEGKSVVDTIVKIVTTDAAGFGELRARYHIPADLESIVLCCLAKEPEQRFSNVGMLLEDLECVRDFKQISDKAKLFSKQDIEAKQRRHRRSLALLALVSAVFVGIVANSVLQMITPSAPLAPSIPAQVSKNKDFQDAWDYDMQAAGDFVKGDYDMAIPRMQFGIEAYKKGFKTGAGTDTERAYMADLYQHIGKCYLNKGIIAQKAGDSAAAKEDFLNAQKNYRDAIPLYNKVAGWYAKSYFTECITDYVQILRFLGQNSEADKLNAEYNSTGLVKTIP